MDRRDLARLMRCFSLSYPPPPSLYPHHLIHHRLVTAYLLVPPGEVGWQITTILGQLTFENSGLKGEIGIQIHL